VDRAPPWCYPTTIFRFFYPSPYFVFTRQICCTPHFVSRLTHHNEADVIDVHAQSAFLKPGSLVHVWGLGGGVFLPPTPTDLALRLFFVLERLCAAVVLPDTSAGTFYGLTFDPPHLLRLRSFVGSNRLQWSWFSYFFFFFPQPDERFKLCPFFDARPRTCHGRRVRGKRVCGVTKTPVYIHQPQTPMFFIPHDIRSRLTSPFYDVERIRCFYRLHPRVRSTRFWIPLPGSRLTPS